MQPKNFSKKFIGLKWVYWTGINTLHPRSGLHEILAIFISHFNSVSNKVNLGLKYLSKSCWLHLVPGITFIKNLKVVSDLLVNIQM
jgi:hypothetical protein